MTDEEVQKAWDDQTWLVYTSPFDKKSRLVRVCSWYAWHTTRKWGIRSREDSLGWHAESSQLRIATPQDFLLEEEPQETDAAFMTTEEFNEVLDILQKEELPRKNKVRVSR